MNMTRTFRPALRRALLSASRWVALVVAFWVVASVQAAGWWSLDFAYRRAVAVPETAFTKLPGDDIAVFTMFTAGLTKPDGADIRVATHDGRERPCRVLMYGPGDQARVAFALAKGVTKYYVYFGAAKDIKPSSLKLDIQRGVLMETWAYDKGNIKQLPEVKAIFDDAKTPLGCDFRDNIFLGYNPFGHENRIASRFTAWLNCPLDGDYIFASTSRDASFLLVDDTTVVDFGGGHEPSGDVRAKGTVTLKAGLHKMTYYHVNVHGDPVAVAAWKPPGGAKIWTIDAKDFAPVTQTIAGPLEQYGRDVTIDFTSTQMGEAFVFNRYYQRYGFKAVISGNLAHKPDWTWDFGDGQTDKDESVEHVYLRPGEYTVTLTTRGAAGEMKRVNKVFVQRPWGRVTKNDLDSVKVQAGIVGSYTYSKLPTAQVAEAMLLMDRAGRPADLILAGNALVGANEAQAEDLDLTMPLYAGALVEKKKVKEAAAALVKAASMTKNPGTQATMLTMAGQHLLMLRDKDSLAKALELFDQVVQKYESSTTVPAIRQAKIGIGDVWRSRMDADKARRAYEDAGDSQENTQVSGEMLRGDFERHIEEYLRTRDFGSAQEYLQKWENSFPADKMDGYWSMLKVKTCMAAAKYDDAVLECDVLVGVNPTSNYAAQLLMLQSEAYDKLKDPDKAKAALRRVMDQYKESPLAIEAAKKLGVTTQPAK